MRSAPFALARVDQMADAVGLLTEQAIIMAGGQVVMPELKLRRRQTDRLIDLSSAKDGRSIELEGATITIGALVSCSDLIASPVIREHLPHLGDAAVLLGDPQTRERATIGGNLAWADPRGNLLVALWPMGATVQCFGKNGVRSLPLTDFVTGFRENALREEIVTSVSVRGGRGVYLEEARQKQELALASVCAVQGPNGLRLAVGGIGPRPVLFDGPYTNAHALQARAGADLPRGYGPWTYRIALAETLLNRAFAELSADAR